MPINRSGSANLLQLCPTITACCALEICGRYRHSSGQDHGRNGIGIDSLHSSDQHPVACHYRAEFRGAGRVVRCHDGSHLS